MSIIECALPECYQMMKGISKLCEVLFTVILFRVKPHVGRF